MAAMEEVAVEVHADAVRWGSQRNLSIHKPS